MAEDGGISISIAREMAAIFDSMASSGATRKKVTLNCGVWGIFPDNSLTPIKANLNIEIFDDMCCLDLDSWINSCVFLPVFEFVYLRLLPIPAIFRTAMRLGVQEL